MGAQTWMLRSWLSCVTPRRSRRRSAARGTTCMFASRATSGGTAGGSVLPSKRWREVRGWRTFTLHVMWITLAWDRDHSIYHLKKWTHTSPATGSYAMFTISVNLLLCLMQIYLLAGVGVNCRFWRFFLYQRWTPCGIRNQDFCLTSVVTTCLQRILWFLLICIA